MMNRGRGHKLPPELVLKIAAMAKAGHAAPVIAEAVGCQQRAVRAAAKRLGLELRRVRDAKADARERLVAAIAAMARAGWTLRAVADHVGMRRDRLSTLAKSRGIEFKSERSGGISPTVRKRPSAQAREPDESFCYTCGDCGRRLSCVPDNGDVPYSPKTVIGGSPLCRTCAAARTAARKARIPDGFLA